VNQNCDKSWTGNEAERSTGLLETIIKIMPSFCGGTTTQNQKYMYSPKKIGKKNSLKYIFSKVVIENGKNAHL
jgi:hypothetical protein